MELVIVQLTDIHIRDEEDLEVLSERTSSLAGAICHHITDSDNTAILFCITGDLAFSGQENQYVAVELIFEEIYSLIARRFPRIGVFTVFVPGNHDCNTIYGWYKTLDDEHKWKLKEFLRKNECYDININIGIMQYLSKCKAKMPIIMVQDILGLDENSRINVPGVESDQNWSWKLINFDDLKERIKDY